jgi:hypothetical protein
MTGHFSGVRQVCRDGWGCTEKGAASVSSRPKSREETPKEGTVKPAVIVNLLFAALQHIR